MLKLNQKVTRVTQKAKYRKSPLNRDIITDEYAALTTNNNVLTTERDWLIASILESDSIQKEIIKREIIDNKRLDIFMKILGLQVAPHHLAFIRFWEILAARGRNTGLMLGPRGSGKSTVSDMSYTAMESIIDRNIHILMASRTKEQAMSFLSAVKSMLEKPQITELFGDLKGDKWDESTIAIAGRDTTDKEQTFHTAGADGAVVSKHFNIIVCDDLVEEKNAKTEGQRDVVMKFYYKSIVPTLRPKCSLRMIGTRYHPEDLYGHVIKHDPMFRDSHFILPGVFDTMTGEYADLVELEGGKFELPEGAQVWDPEGFPADVLLERREGMPQGDFEAQYQNRVEFLRGDYFTSDWFKYYDEAPSDLVEKYDLSVWMGVDLAASQKSSADEFAIVVVGIIPSTFEIYVLDTFAARLTFNKQKQVLKHMFDTWDPVRSFVESNAYQSVLESTVAEEFPDIRTTPIWTTQDKITRAQAFQLYYERGQVYHRRGRSAKLEGQLTGFPHLKLKDLFDALYISVWGAMRGGRRQGKRKEEPKLFGG